MDAKGDAMKLKATLLMTEVVTHDVKRFILTKPKGLGWIPGQGVLMAINTPELKDEDHPFTPTSLPSDGVLEFTIKGYPRRHGLTEKLHNLRPGAELLITMVFGDIRYRGPGVFIGGGAGITPFLGILRQLRKDGKLAGNSLIFSNKRWEDIILERELREYLGDRCTFLLTREKRPGYESGKIDAAFLKRKIGNFKQRFYVCGPAKFIEGINGALVKLRARQPNIIFDEP